MADNEIMILDRISNDSIATRNFLISSLYHLLTDSLKLNCCYDNTSKILTIYNENLKPLASYDFKDERYTNNDLLNISAIIKGGCYD